MYPRAQYRRCSLSMPQYLKVVSDEQVPRLILHFSKVTFSIDLNVLPCPISNYLTTDLRNIWVVKEKVSEWGLTIELARLHFKFKFSFGHNNRSFHNCRAEWWRNFLNTRCNNRSDFRLFFWSRFWQDIGPFPDVKSQKSYRENNNCADHCEILHSTTIQKRLILSGFRILWCVWDIWRNSRREESKQCLNHYSIFYCMPQEGTENESWNS